MKTICKMFRAGLGSLPSTFPSTSYNSYNSCKRGRSMKQVRSIGAHYAPARGEWKTFEAHRKSPRLDTE
jgi:hypothetical protein